MDKLQIKVTNFRSFLSTAEIEIAPITILLGRNSCGKSSITRLFPLLQQTQESRTSSPILWYGNIVDFGSISDALPRSRPEGEVSFRFCFSNAQLQRESIGYPTSRRRRRLSLESADIEYEVRMRGSQEKTVIAGISINIGNDTVQISCSNDRRITSLNVNQVDYTEWYSQNYRLTQTTFVPSLTIPVQPADIPYTIKSFPDELRQDTFKLFSSFFHGRTEEETKIRCFGWSYFTSTDRFRDMLLEIPGTSDYYTQRVKRTHSPFIEELRRRLLLRQIDELLQIIRGFLASLFLESSYVGPSRSTAARYYRLQELAVDRIDPSGANFAMFLMSLTADRRKMFAEIFRSIFDHEIDVRREGGNASVFVREGVGGQWMNLTDVGYGFSQLLPVTAQLFASTHRRGRIAVAQGVGRPVPRIVAIEQPELHLHPDFQARLADLFVQTVADTSAPNPNASDIRIVCETHSEMLVNRLGYMIATGRVQSRNVAMFIFDRTSPMEGTSVHRAWFRPDGTIENWPAGFFIPRTM